MLSERHWQAQSQVDQCRNEKPNTNISFDSNVWYLLGRHLNETLFTYFSQEFNELTKT
jgi:hypothetical protein